MKSIKINLVNSLGSVYTVNFKLLKSPIAEKWYQELAAVLKLSSPIDDPERFYCFPNSRFTKEYTVDYINQLIKTINDYSPGLIEKTATVDMNQDTLNYLHHIFEVYHGLYDCQDTNDFFKNAPESVQRALGDLNIWIHRYESLNSCPRFVVTWRHKPSRKLLENRDFEYFTLHEDWGDLRINYCEIGKTLHDIYRDNDHYINKEAFLPQKYYSCDFTVRFCQQSFIESIEEEKRVWQYYDHNENFFNSLGYKKFAPRLALGGITVAKIITHESKQSVIEQIGLHQSIQSIELL